MATSSIPVVTDAILAMLNAATWPGNRPQILDDITDEPNRESVIVGDTAGSSQRDWSTVGGGRIWEQYAIKLWIFAVTPGQTPKKARDRVYELAGVIDTALRAAISPDDGSILIAGFNGSATKVADARLDTLEHINGLLDEGWGCSIRTAVLVKAQT